MVYPTSLCLFWGMCSTIGSPREPSLVALPRITLLNKGSRPVWEGQDDYRPITLLYQVKNPRCRHKVIHRKRVTCELHDSYFRSMTIKHAIPKTAGVHIPLASYGKISWRRVHISAWEFDGNIRPTNWTEDSEKFRCSRKLVPSLPRVRFLGHRLLTLKSPGPIDERF